MTAQQQVRAIAANTEDFMLGRISEQEFRRRAARLREQKLEEERKRRAS